MDAATGSLLDTGAHGDHRAGARRCSTRRSSELRGRGDAERVRRVHRPSSADRASSALSDDFVDFLTLPAYELDRVSARRTSLDGADLAARRRPTGRSRRAAGAALPGRRRPPPAGAHRATCRPTGTRRDLRGRVGRRGARPRSTSTAGSRRCAATVGLTTGSPRRSRRGCARSSTREPIEDLRLDFEDGYGDRGDETEDADAVRAAERSPRRSAPGRAAVHRASGSSASRRRPGAAACAPSTCSSTACSSAAACRTASR